MEILSTKIETDIIGSLGRSAKNAPELLYSFLLSRCCSYAWSIIFAVNENIVAFLNQKYNFALNLILLIISYLYHYETFLYQKNITFSLTLTR